MKMFGQVEKIKNLDLMARCKARTFRVALMAAIPDFEYNEFIEKINQLEKSISSDERFRREVRKLVKEFEEKDKEQANREEKRDNLWTT